MENWQEKASAWWPEYREEIEEAFSASEFWVTTLWPAFFAYHYPYREQDEAAIRRFYEYALGSLDATEEMFHAAVYDFYENLPNHEQIRAEMPYFLTTEQIANLKEIWRYGRSDEEYVALLQELQEYRAGTFPLQPKVLPRHAFVGISSRNKKQER